MWDKSPPASAALPPFLAAMRGPLRICLPSSLLGASTEQKAEACTGSARQEATELGGGGQLVSVHGGNGPTLFGAGAEAGKGDQPRGWSRLSPKPGEECSCLCQKLQRERRKARPGVAPCLSTYWGLGVTQTGAEAHPAAPRHPEVTELHQVLGHRGKEGGRSCVPHETEGGQPRKGAWTPRRQKGSRVGGRALLAQRASRVALGWSPASAEKQVNSPSIL